jgi:hypothetical protein
MDEIITYKMCAVKVRNAKLRNYLKFVLFERTFKIRILLGFMQRAFRHLGYVFDMHTSQVG